MSKQLSTKITGQAPPQKPGYVAAPQDDVLREKVAKWYFAPLRAMKGDQAFICLGMCFALYEKYLRATGAMSGDKFSQGDKVFEVVGEDINTDPNTAYLIWNSWRNGLLHRAMPKEKQEAMWAITDNQNVPVKKDGTTITLNPWLLRKRILDVVESERDIWNDRESPLMSVYELSPLK
jgi:hypothetical protein